MLARLARTVARLTDPSLIRRVARRTRPGLIAYSLTDEPVVQALGRASDAEAVVAVYDDGSAPYATAGTLERELGVSLPRNREVTLPSVPTHSFGRTRRTIRARTLSDAEPPVVLLSRRSLRDWDERVRNFVLAHEFGHLWAESQLGAELPSTEAVVESLLPLPDQSALAVRALVEAHREYRAGETHAGFRAELPERHRTPPEVMAEYHAAERASEDGAMLSDGERRALAIRNAAKYLPLPYDPPGVEDEVRTALAEPLPRYVDWATEQGGKAGTRA
jgi:hypothetical protein